MAKTHTFTVDIKSDEDERHYEGSFTTKRLSIRDQSKLQVRKIQLSNGMHYDPEAPPGQGLDIATHVLNHMLAHLEISITEAPDWWNLDDITDPEVVETVFEEVLSFESSKRSTGENQKTSSDKSEESDSGVSDNAVVDKEVPAALQP